jgi:hypothetical protein
LRGHTLSAVAAALGRAVDLARIPPLVLSEIDGEPASASRLAPSLLAAGFRASSAGLVRRRGVGEPARAPVDRDREADIGPPGDEDEATSGPWTGHDDA